VKAAAEYLLGNDQRGLRHYTPYKFVSRASAYGKPSDAPAGYFSWKQFRYVMAMLHGGGGGGRTGKLKDGWATKGQGGGFGMSVYNSVDYATYVMGDAGQARQPAKVGWRKLMAVVNSNLNGMMRAASQAVGRWIKEHGG
jgi:hypothetical protein